MIYFQCRPNKKYFNFKERNGSRTKVFNPCEAGVSQTYILRVYKHLGSEQAFLDYINACTRESIQRHGCIKKDRGQATGVKVINSLAGDKSCGYPTQTDSFTFIPFLRKPQCRKSDSHLTGFCIMLPDLLSLRIAFTRQELSVLFQVICVHAASNSIIGLRKWHSVYARVSFKS